MQNLPISTATLPAASVQSSAPSSTAAERNHVAQIAEPFGRVLARQRAHADGQGSNSQPAATPASGAEEQAPLPDAVNTLPGDMLAALLPANSAIKAVAANEKSAVAAAEKKAAAANEKSDTPASASAPAPDSVSTLPSDMLAALLPPPVAMQDARAAIQTQPILAGVPDEAQPAAAGSQQVALLLRAQAANSRPDAAVAAASAKGNVFSAVLGTTVKDAASIAQLNRGVAQLNNGVAQLNNGTPELSNGAAQFINGIAQLNSGAERLSSGAEKISAQAVLPDAAATLASQLQGGMTPVAASPHVPAQAVVNTPVTNDRWGDDFSQKITWLVTQQAQSAELHLNPPDLGPLDVVLKVSGDQATALFTSAHAAVREAVEQALPKLREMLADNGIMLGNAMVSDQSPKEQQMADNKQRKAEGRLSGVDAAAGGVQSDSTLAPVRRQQGMLDTFA